jgi:CubicO group peptidase (beta-lactamase class C family)
MLFLAVASCAISQPINNLQRELEALLLEELAADEPGGSVLVKKGDDIIFLNSYGLEDLSTGKKITENTLFNTGSISKTFVSNGILILNERGILSLEDGIHKYFNDFDNSDLAKKITIKHLLSHTSGLPDSRNVKDNVEYYLTAKDEENFEPLKHTEGLNFKPGAKFQYSNPAYNGLALIIEKLSNQPWQNFIEDNIFIPSGMSQSTITNGPHPSTGVAHGYIQDETGHFIEYDYGEFPTFAAAGNGGVWSSVMELANYESAIQANVFLSEVLTMESRTVYQPRNWSDTLAPFVGYSWFLGESSLFDNSNFDVDIIYHTGSQGGFKAFYITIPEKDILFIGLFNKPLKNFRKLMYDAIALFEENNWLDQ